VIAFEEVSLEALRKPFSGDLDHLAAVRTAIDVIAEKDERAPLHLPARRRVGRDRCDEVSQQIGPAMNVADGIQQLA
jgi:hypothetical protein